MMGRSGLCRRGRRGLLHAAALLVALSGGLWWSPAAGGAVHDPALRWRTLETPHFHIHYAEGLEPEARRLAEVAERVHGPMVEALGWEPRQPTEITLVDRTDLANGFTTILPYNQIVLYPVLPGLFQSIGDYNGWLETVFIHEYAHVLGLDPVRGYSAVFRGIFGRVFVPTTPVGAIFWFLALPPNVLLPPWFHEGLAVNLETDLTGRGRKGSTFYDMIYRVDVASGTVPPLDRLGGDFPDWPSFGTRYIYGTRLLQTAQEERGKAVLRELVLGHSSRFPYAIDAPPYRATGTTYSGLYERMRAGLETQYRPDVERLRREDLTQVSEVPNPVYSEVGPLWLDGDTVAVTRRTGVRPAVLVAKRLSDGREEVLAERSAGEGPPTRLPDGRVAFTRVEVSKPLAGGLLYSDLYAVRPDGRGLERLTHAARLVEADFNPAAGTFVGVQARASSRRLVRVTPSGSEPAIEPLLDEEGVRYDGPRWSPDGKWVAFSRKTDAGHARLALLEAATGAVRLVTPEGSQAGFPSWSPDGTRLVFSWDRTGVFDLYELEVGSGEIRRLTRVLGGAFEPAWSPDGARLAFTSYSAKGFSVALVARSACLAEPVDAPAPERLKVGAPRPAEPVTLSESVPYSPLPRALPTFWLPDLIGDHQGPAPGVWTAGTDPLTQHLYYLSGYWAVASHRFYGFGLYRNDVGYPTVTVRAAKLPVFYTELLESPTGDYDYWEENRSVGVEARFSLPRMLRAWSFAVGWAWEEVTRLSRVDEDLDGQQALADEPFQGKLNPLTVSLLYDSAFPHDNRFTVGAEAGTRLEGVYRLRTEALGADLNLQDVTGQWREYLPIPGLLRTALAFRAKGGVGWGDVPVQSVYQVGGEGGEFPVRGYPFRVDRGKRAFSGSAELRFPLWSPYRGHRDWAVLLGRVHAAGFFDAGKAWDGGDGGDGEWRRGAGGELRVDTVLGYYLPTTLVAGYGHGLDDGGENRIYLTFTGVY